MRENITTVIGYRTRCCKNYFQKSKSNDDKIVKPDENPRNIEKNNYSTRKKRNVIKIEKSIIKMEHCKISKILNDSTVYKFATKKWIKVNDLSSDQYSVNKNIRFRTSIPKSDLCDYRDAYIFVKGTITIEGNNANNRVSFGGFSILHWLTVK